MFLSAIVDLDLCNPFTLSVPCSTTAVVTVEQAKMLASANG